MAKARSVQLLPNDDAVELKVQIVRQTALINSGILIVKCHLVPLGLAFPANATKRCLPPLYPANACGGGL